MTEAKLLAVGSNAESCEVTELGKYWGFRFDHWVKVKVLRLPCARGGTGEIAFAPIDRRGYPYAGGIALSACSALWGPVKAWGDAPPKVSRQALLDAGVDEFWLPKKKRGRGGGTRRDLASADGGMRGLADQNALRDLIG